MDVEEIRAQMGDVHKLILEQKQKVNDLVWELSKARNVQKILLTRYQDLDRRLFETLHPVKRIKISKRSLAPEKTKPQLKPIEQMSKKEAADMLRLLQKRLDVF